MHFVPWSCAESALQLRGRSPCCAGGQGLGSESWSTTLPNGDKKAYTSSAYPLYLDLSCKLSGGTVRKFYFMILLDGSFPFSKLKCKNAKFFFFFQFLFIFTLFEKQRDTERARWREIFHPLVHIPNAGNSLGWARWKPGWLNRHLGISQSWRGPKYFSHHLLLSQAH